MTKYWFENSDSDFSKKPWHLDFLVSLDENRGNLDKLCKAGGEDVEDVLAFINSDDQLVKSVKVIILKYSENRYNKYFDDRKDILKKSSGRQKLRIIPEPKVFITETSSNEENASGQKLSLQSKIENVQSLKRRRKHREALAYARQLINQHPTEPLAYKSLSKVQAVSGDVKGAIESMNMVLQLYQTDMVTEFVDYQYGRGFTQLFREMFTEYINAAYYLRVFSKHKTRPLPQDVVSTLAEDYSPKLPNGKQLRQYIMEGIKLSNPLWSRNPNDFKRVIEGLVDSISLK